LVSGLSLLKGLPRHHHLDYTGHTAIRLLQRTADSPRTCCLAGNSHRNFGLKADAPFRLSAVKSARQPLMLPDCSYILPDRK
ncbi:unnamed protein product, partial [Ectocarpus sp. 8 AP-2014]